MESPALPGNPRQIAVLLVAPALAIDALARVHRSSVMSRCRSYKCLLSLARMVYSQSGGMDAIASSEPHGRFFFAGVKPGLE